MRNQVFRGRKPLTSEPAVEGAINPRAAAHQIANRTPEARQVGPGAGEATKLREAGNSILSLVSEKPAHRASAAPTLGTALCSSAARLPKKGASGDEIGRTTGQFGGQDRLLRIGQIVGPNGLIPVSKSTWWAWTRSQYAPQPIRLSKRVTAWLESEVLAFIASHNVSREL